MTSPPNSIDDLGKATAGDLSRAYAARTVSPVEVVRLALARAEEVDGALNAFSLIDHDRALAAARRSETRWHNGTPLSPVDGVPATVKDLVLCGLDIRYGSCVTKDVSELPDSPVAERLRKAGIIILGVTNTPEFGWKAVTDSPRNGITRNPWDESKTPGGSSGGAAVAAATGAGTLHVGTDGGGSIRIPASFCGIVGHKPSFGRVPAYPASAFGTVAHIGPMARTVEDVVLMLNVMSGRDIRDWNQPLSAPTAVDPKTVNWNGRRIGFWNVPCVGELDPEVEVAITSTVRDLALAGAHVDEIRLPEQDTLLEVFYRHWHIGAANRFSTIDDTDHARLDPGFLDAATRGSRYTAVERMQAEIARAQFGTKMDALLETFDYVLSPTVPIPPFEAGSDVPSESSYKSWVEWSSFSYPVNLSQQPACSVPCGRTASDLPIGLQIIGARGHDADVLSAALTIEQMYPEHFMLAHGKWPSCGNGVV